MPASPWFERATLSRHARERSSLVARGTDGPAHLRKAQSAFQTTTLDGGQFHRPPTRRTRTFAAHGAANSGERRSSDDTCRERERPPQAVGAVRRRPRGTGSPSVRWRDDDAVVRESDALSSSAHGRLRRPFAWSAGLDESRAYHERREAPFKRPRNWVPAAPVPRAALSREDIARSIAPSNDSESWAAKRRRRLEPCERAARR